MGKHNRSVMVAVYGIPCAIPPINSNSMHECFTRVNTISDVNTNKGTQLAVTL
jgi:hypothetical protein